MRNWYTIKAAADKTAEVYIYEEIGDFWGEGVAAKTFVKDLTALKVSVINLRINSPGGNVFDGFAIYNALVRHPARVIVDIDGLAASAASFVALAGNEIRMAQNASLMIHNPQGGVLGEASDMRKVANILDEIKNSIVGIYTARVKQEESQVRTWMDAESWFDATEAKHLGFIDEITPNLNASNCYNLSRYKHAPSHLVGGDGKPGLNNARFTRMANAIDKYSKSKGV